MTRHIFLYTAILISITIPSDANARGDAAGDTIFYSTPIFYDARDPDGPRINLNIFGETGAFYLDTGSAPTFFFETKSHSTAARLSDFLSKPDSSYRRIPLGGSFTGAEIATAFLIPDPPWLESADLKGLFSPQIADARHKDRRFYRQ